MYLLNIIALASTHSLSVGICTQVNLVSSAQASICSFFSMSKEVLRDCHITNKSCRTLGSSDWVPDEVPSWWPRRNGEPVPGLYRCCYGNMKEFSCDAQPNHLGKLCTSRIELFEHFVYYVANGSKKTIDSPFLHFTMDFWKALAYRDKTKYPDGRSEVVVYLD